MLLAAGDVDDPGHKASESGFVHWFEYIREVVVGDFNGDGNPTSQPLCRAQFNLILRTYTVDPIHRNLQQLQDHRL
jgi:hypothetical protein